VAGEAGDDLGQQRGLARPGLPHQRQRTALAEARRLRDLAAEAPPEIRADFRALAEAVVDIVGLLEDERAASDGTGGGSPGPAEVERRREQLNDRLGQLDRRSLRVATWSSRECGLDLT